MSEEKLKKLHALLTAAEAAQGTEGRNAALIAVGDFILDAAMWGGIVLKNTDGGYTFRMEV